MVVRCALLAAVAVGAVSAVTLETSTPTEASNFMVMQGDFEYVVGGTNFGAVSGRAQLLRSALEARSIFSLSIKMQNFNAGDEFEAVVRRHPCSLGGAIPYQDPYVCPGYNSIEGSNSCDSQSVGDANPIEVRLACTVDAKGKCQAEFVWEIYIPEEKFEGQALEDLAIELFPKGTTQTFVCADLTDSRDTTATEVTRAPDASGNNGELALGGMQKDELGYTHVYFLAQSLRPSFTYKAYIADGPCEAQFTTADPIAGLQFSFATDGSGSAIDVMHHIDTIAGPESQSLAVTDCLNTDQTQDASGGCPGGTPVILCYDLELMVGPAGRSGTFTSGGASQGADNKNEVNMKVTSEEIDPEISNCEAWQHLYKDTGHSGKKGKDGKKGKGKGKAGAFGQFKDKQINGVTRCCVHQQYEIGKTKEGTRFAKTGALTARANAVHHSSVFVGVGAGIAGAVVLAFGVMLHMRRTQQSDLPDYACNPTEVSENTPLTTTNLQQSETDIDAAVSKAAASRTSSAGSK